MTTMYRASTIGMEIEEYPCKSFTDKTVTTENGRRNNRDVGWYCICESEKDAVEWLKPHYENRVKSAEYSLGLAQKALKNFTEKYGESK